MEQQADETATEESTSGPWRLLAEVERVAQPVMLVLALIWLLLVIAELVWTNSAIVRLLGTAIWIVFIAEFLLRLALAPQKLHFLRNNLITLVALVAPAFRLFAALRFLRLARGVRLVRIVGTANRSLKAVRKSFGRRGLSYVFIATALITFLGAAGMFAFEPASAVPGGFTGYGDALWWTAMLLSTMGSGFWPVTPEGRLLALLLSLYGLAVFGYITASIATFFIGQDAVANNGPLASGEELKALRREITLLRSDLHK